MPPKKNQAKPEAVKKQDMVEEAPLQAVVLADSYNRRFEVLCSDRPRILLPFCSTPLLAWTLEALSLSKVKQVFLFCGIHGDQIRDYVERLMDILCIVSQTAFSPGDALRELDGMGVLNGDNPFILVHSPLVSNYDLSQMVDTHKKLRAKDANYIMTMGVGRGGRKHPESPLMLVHPPTRRLLSYTPSPLLPSPSRAVFPGNIFADPYNNSMKTFEIWSGTSSRSGYRDLGVDICEADVPALCTENFDYNDLRRHFVRGVLGSELLGKKIAVHLVGEEGPGALKGKRDKRSGDGGRYIERIRDTRTYGDVSRDVLNRWAFPVAPDLTTLEGGSVSSATGGSQYELRHGNVYVAKEDVKLALSTEIRGPSLLSPHTTISSSTLISSSILGRCASIGSNTSITKSFIFDQATIGSNCILTECIVGENVVLEDGVEIGRGALIGDGVKLAKGVRVPEFSRVGRRRYRKDGWEEGDEEDDEDARLEEERLEILGESSLGFFWPPDEEQTEEPDSDDSDDGEDPYEHPRNKKLLQLGRRLSTLSDDRSVESCSTLSKASDSDYDLSDDDDDGDYNYNYQSDDDGASGGDGGLETSIHGMTNLSMGPGTSAAFRAEAYGTLQRAWDEDHATKNLEVEFGLLVPAFNAGVDAAREEVVRFFISKIDVSGGVAGVLANGTKIMERWGSIMTKYATSDKTSIVLDIQRYLSEDAHARQGEGKVDGHGNGHANGQIYAPFFGVLLRAAYESDLLDESTLVRWRDSRDAQTAPRGSKVDEGRWDDVYKRGKVYVDVLESMDSDDEEEDESEDGDGDGESEEDSD